MPMNRKSRTIRSRLVALGFAAVIGAAAFMPASTVLAEDVDATASATYGEIETAFGGVPGFVKLFPKAGIAGAWSELAAVSFGDTALPAKTKALISLAVAAQIPCNYCVWSDTEDAKRAGATQEEIAEAVAVAALTRHWSTFFNGMQIDFETFKKEFSGDFSGQ